MSKVLADQSALENVIAPVCQAQGVELVCVHFGAEQGGPVLRVMIELPDAATLPKEVGVTLDDCTRVSRALSPVLDEDDTLIEGAYRLEVSSAGIERPLVKAHDFERYAGRQVHVSTRKPVDARKNFTGLLLGLSGDAVSLRLEQERELSIPLRDIAKAHLVYRF
jgi:ribosome maturation factor RimP